MLLIRQRDVFSILCRMTADGWKMWACDPPDIILAPRIEEIGFMDFHRAAESIEIGQRCVQQNEREITLLMSI
jgi:predicted acylesterase/phospholipase RssA